MSRKGRSASQRSRSGRAASSPPPAARPPRAKKADVDPMAVYRSLASPSLRIRWILALGLAFFTTAQAIAIADAKATDAPAALALLGVVCIAVFLGSGFVRHYRALYRIRRDSPEAWQPTMRFAFASLAVPLGFGGQPADDRERLVRRVTLLLLLAFAITAVVGSRTTKTR